MCEHLLSVWEFFCVRHSREFVVFKERDMRKNKGFTLIELMIVIAIIAIIAAIAIPNLMQSRLRANEATAITCIRNYGTAQVTFQLGQQASVATNTDIANSGLRGFADNFRNLFYGNPRTTPAAGGVYNADTTRTLSLISQAMADAFADSPAGMATVTTPLNGIGDGTVSDHIVYQGYYFTEDPEMFNIAEGFASNYAMVAVPANSSSTGNNAFWMDSENSVMKRGLVADDLYDNILTATITGDTPLNGGTARANWQSL